MATPFQPTGQTVGHYRILRKLGGGGMGVVYEAEDLELGRHVALKFLPEELGRDRAALERFRLEARTASSLNHPNICVIHEIGTAEDGRLFIVMELMQGETLKQRIHRGNIQVSEMLHYATQIAEALSAAHAKGIVHRDIKPANIFVSEGGQIKLLDFGLAKQAQGAAPANSDANTASIASEPLTGPGTTLGTLGYMSPEQALGKKIDARSDLFSTGVVLYEMATGNQPFIGDTAHAVVDSLLHHQPKTPSELNPKLPAKLDELIFKALEKDPAVRCQSAAELKADLLRVRRDLDAHMVGPAVALSVKSSPPGKLWISLAALILLTGAAVLVFYKTARRSPQIASIAVLPLANVPANPDTDYVSDGISEGLINSLSELPQLRVISRNGVARYKGHDVDAAAAGRELGVQAVLAGQVRQRGNDISISIELVDAASNAHLWGADYTGNVNDLLSLNNEITTDLAKRLRGSSTAGTQQLMSHSSTSNPEAYQLYLKGRYFIEKYTEEGVDKGIECFQQAIKLDPNYALAYEGLSYAYWVEDDLFVAPHDIEPQAREAAQKALQIDDSLASAHTDLGLVYFVYDFDWLAAEREFKRAVELQPNYAEAHEYLGWLFAVQGRSAEAVIENRRALEADPLSAEANFVVAQTLFLLHQQDGVIEQGNTALELDPNYFMAEEMVGAAYAQKKDFSAATRVLQKASYDEPNVYWSLAYMGRIYALSGDSAHARQILSRLMTMSKKRYVCAYYFALIYDALGQKDQAIAALEKGYDDRSVYLTFVPVDPAFEDLHSEPRFRILLKRLGLPQQAGR
jgi:serine/threonine protein kinase/Tfp pilus assembly protein PilF